MVYTNLLSHPKTGRLVDTLGLKSPSVEPEVIAAGMLVSLWTWAAQNAYHGDLSECSDRVIAQACRWKKDAGKLIQALQECGWLDGKVLHDWEEYAELYINMEENRKANDRERARAYRARKKIVTMCDASRDDNVTVTEASRGNHAVTRHNITEHNITEPSSPSFLEKERKGEKKESDVERSPADDDGYDFSGYQLVNPPQFVYR